MDLGIRPIVPNTLEHPAPKADTLLQHEFSLGIIAPKGSGKTTLMQNLLLRDEFYRGYFHRIYIFSPSIESDPKWDWVLEQPGVLGINQTYRKFIRKIKNKLQAQEQDVNLVIGENPKLVAEFERLEADARHDGRLDRNHVFTHYDRDTLKNLLFEIEAHLHLIKEHLEPKDQANAKFIADRVLFLFDDMVGSSLFSMSRQANPFLELNIRHRHFNCSLIEVSQAYKEIPKTVRTNWSGLILFSIANMAELDVIYEEYPMGKTKEAWMVLYQHAVAEPYSFLFINYQKKDPKQRMLKRFESYLVMQ